MPSVTSRTSLVAFALVTTFAFTAPAEAMGISYSWRGIAACGKTSPAFRLTDVPQGTRALRFMMTDLNVPQFHHGGSTVRYEGQKTVPQGAVTYTGPCPPRGERHRYRWTVEALDAQGKALAKTTATQTFPP